MRFIIYFLWGFIFSIDAFSAEYYRTNEVSVLKRHVDFLCQDTLAGRLTGTIGEKRAADYVAKQFRQLGLIPVGDNRSYFQEFKFVSLKKNTQTGYNVLGKLIVNPHAKESIIIGAHIDHLGRKANKIFPGADDNASGVASMLEVAAFLVNLKSHGKLSGNKNIVFSAWSGEELGLLGSSYFVKHINRQQLIDAVINLDMVGRLRKSLVLQGMGSSADWPNIVKIAKKKHSLNLILQDDPYLPTDVTSFYLKQIPVLNFFTGAHLDYHMPSDKPEFINYEGIKKISAFLVDLIVVMEKQNKPMQYIQVKKPHRDVKTHFKVYFGTVPDYASADIDGVKLAGVINGSPAQQSGLRANDTIIGLANRKIHNIYDYTFGLMELHPGKLTKITILRGHRKLKLKITGA